MANDLRANGDYPARFYGGNLAAARTTLYTALDNVYGIIRHINLCNTTGSSKTVQIWVGGIQVDISAVVPANDARAVDVSMWLLLPTQQLEMQASATGVTCVVYGIEQVGA